MILTREAVNNFLRELEEVEAINLESCEVEAISSDAFQDHQELYTINLSKNILTSLPDDFKPGKNIMRLDLSFNQLRGFASVQQALLNCPTIEEICVEGNVEFPLLEQQKLIYTLPRLRRMNDKPADGDKFGNSLTNDLITQVSDKWRDKKKSYHKKFSGSMSKISLEFTKDAVRTIKSGSSGLRAFVKWRLESDIIPGFLTRYNENQNLLDQECAPLGKSFGPGVATGTKSGPGKKTAGRPKSDSGTGSLFSNVDTTKEIKRAKGMICMKNDAVMERYSIEDRNEYIQSRFCSLYSPDSFLRAHGHTTTTSIWALAFNPKNQNMIASAGGESIIISDLETQEPLGKFTIEKEKQMYSLCWFIQYKRTFLAVGGKSGNVYFIDIEDFKSFGEIKDLHADSVNEIVFRARPESPTIDSLMITCGVGHEEKGCFHVNLTDVRIEPEGKRYSSQVLCSFKTSPAGNPLRILPINESLMVGCEDTPGILVWGRSWKQSVERKTSLKRPIGFDYKLAWPNVCPQLMTIDGLTILNESQGLLAAKISASRKLLENVKKEDSNYTHPGMILIIQFFDWNNEAEVRRRLDYSNTNEIYMGIQYIPSVNILAAGDEVGQIWCYDISEIIDGKNEGDDACIFPVDGVLPFPNVYQGGVPVEELKIKPEILNNNNVKKEGSSSRQVNMITVNKSGTILVTACSCNILCLYKPHENLIVPELNDSESDSSENEESDEMS